MYITSTNPELKWIWQLEKNRQAIKDKEVDFLKLFHGTFYLNAKEYFKSIYGTDTGTG